MGGAPAVVAGVCAQAASRPHCGPCPALALAVLFHDLDATIVHTALPAMARDLGESPLQMHSAVVSHSLALAGDGIPADRETPRYLILPLPSLRSMSQHSE